MVNSSDQLPLPPGQWGLPVLGETLGFFNDAQFASKRHQRYGDVFKTRLLGKPMVFVRGVEANRFVFTHENQDLVVTWPDSTKALLGPLSLSLQTGEMHQSRRKLLAQAFLPRSLSGYIATMEAITQHYSQRWVDQGTITWYPELRRYTFDIACKLLVGFDEGSKTDLGHWFETWCDGLFSIPLPFPWTKFGRARRCRDRLLQALEPIIRQRQAAPNPGNDVLGLLVQARDEEGNSLSLEELKDQILLLLFAGHETLTSAVASFCLLTAQSPEILAKLREEQHQWMEHPLTLDTLKQMTYLEQVLKEVLRRIPPVGGGFREVVQTCELQGYQIPKGWVVSYQIGATHQLPDLYPEPKTFNPDHFQPTDSQSIDRQKYGYVPFGGGIRECLGKEFARLEMKIFAVHLLRGYQWDLLPDQDLTLKMIPTPHPQDGLRVQFHPLSQPQQ